MPVKTKPIAFETSDGHEFDDKEEADRHEELITARNAYADKKKAENALINALHSWLDEQRRQVTETTKQLRERE